MSFAQRWAGSAYGAARARPGMLSGPSVPWLLFFVLLPVCLLLWSTASSERVLLLLLGVCIGMPLLLLLPFRWSVLLPFAATLWLGEGFHLSERFAIPVHALLLLVVLVSCAVRPGPVLARLASDRLLLCFIGLFVVSLCSGVAAKSDWVVLKEDAAPFLYFIAIYAAAATQLRGWRELADVLRGIVLLTCLTAAKVVYLAVSGVPAGWDSEWQAVVVRGAGPLDARIILRGADLFWFVGATFLMGALLVTPAILRKVGMLLPLLILSAGMFFSATRSNWIGFAAAALAQILFVFRQGWRSQRRLAGAALALLLLAALGAVLELQPEYSFKQKLQMRYEEPTQQFAVGVRVSEASGLLESLGWGWIAGRGFGSEYSYRDDLVGTLRTSWSHNSYLFLLLKMGLAGVVAYLALLATGLRRLWQHALAARDARETSTCVGVLGAMVCLCVLSLAVNKNFAVSGALFSGLVLGAVRNWPPAGAAAEIRGVRP